MMSNLFVFGLPVIAAFENRGEVGALLQKTSRLEIQDLQRNHNEGVQCDLYVWTADGIKAVEGSEQLSTLGNPAAGQVLTKDQWDKMQEQSVRSYVDQGRLECVASVEQVQLTQQALHVGGFEYAWLGDGVCRRADGSKDYTEVQAVTEGACTAACNLEMSCAAIAWVTGQDRCFLYAAGPYTRVVGKRTRATCFLRSTPTYAMPLTVRGANIMDSSGAKVKLGCTSWYGANMKQFVQNGLSVRSEVQIARKIAEMGFNCVRLPFSTEMFISNPEVRPEYINATTSECRGGRALNVFDGVIKALTDEKLAVIINHQMHDAGFCCSWKDGNGIHYNARWTKDQWIDSLVGMARRYKDNKLVVAIEPMTAPRPDMQNKVMYSWGETLAAGKLQWMQLVDLRPVYEEATQAINAENPEALVILNPSGHANVQCQWMLEKYPLRNVSNVVWGAHDNTWAQFSVLNGMCAPGGNSFNIVGAWMNMQRWETMDLPDFSTMSYDEFAALRDVAYGHLVGTVPVLLADFSITDPARNGNKQYWSFLMRYIQEKDLGFAYWSVDGERWPSAALAFGEAAGLPEQQNETTGLLSADYNSLRHEGKVRDLQALNPTPVLF